MTTRLIEIDAADLPPDEATTTVAHRLGAAIADGEPFQALVRMPSTTERAHGPQATRSVRMLKEIRPGLARLCTALAFVTDESTLAARGRSPEAEARLWGCPVATVTGDDHARAWLASRSDGGER